MFGPGLFRDHETVWRGCVSGMSVYLTMPPLRHYIAMIPSERLINYLSTTPIAE